MVEFSYVGNILVQCTLYKLNIHITSSVCGYIIVFFVFYVLLNDFIALFHWFWLFCYWPNSIYWHCALDLVNVVRMTWYAFDKSSAVCSSGMHMSIVLGKKPVRAHLLVLLCYHAAIIFDAKYHKKCHSE